jgi:MFS transporter, MHS family, proline/betaine transporter
MVPPKADTAILNPGTAYMLVVAGPVGAITLIFAPEVAGKPLLGSGPSVGSPGEARGLVGT